MTNASQRVFYSRFPRGKGHHPHPFACGKWISTKDSHGLGISCSGAKHAQASLSNPKGCPHCLKFSLKTREQRLHVAVTGKSTQRGTNGLFAGQQLVGRDDGEGVARPFPTVRGSVRRRERWRGRSVVGHPRGILPPIQSRLAMADPPPPPRRIICG